MRTSSERKKALQAQSWLRMNVSLLVCGMVVAKVSIYREDCLVAVIGKWSVVGQESKLFRKGQAAIHDMPRSRKSASCSLPS